MTKLKNALFHFVKMRGVEQISDANKANHFIYHPDLGNSSLNTASKSDFISSINTFSPEKVQNLKNPHQALYDFGLWLLKNKADLTKADFEAQKTALAPNALSNAEKISLWDNFVMQCYTDHDFQAREVAYTLIYADFLLAKVQTSTEEADFKILLKAKLVIPTELAFGQGESNTSTSQNPQKVSLKTKKTFEKIQKTAEAKEDQKAYKALLSEVEKAAQQYFKAEQKSKVSYQERYNGQVLDYYIRKASEAGTSSTTEPARSESPESTNSNDFIIPDPDFPAYDYTPSPELDSNFLSNQLSTEAYALFSDLNNSNNESFEEVRTQINNRIEDLEEQQILDPFEGQGQQGTILIGHNIRMPWRNRLEDLAFRLCTHFLRMPMGKIRFDFAFNLPKGANFVRYITYGLYQDGTLLEESEKIATFTAYPSGAVQTFLFPEGIDEPTPNNNLSLKITLATDTGKSYEIDSPMQLKGCNEGFATEVPEDTGGTDPQPTHEPKRFGITNLGVADYQKVEQFLCCYVPGEVAHIENIMARELKERQTEKLRKTEDTTFQSSETETEQLTDTTSTERFEMQKEVSSILAESRDFNLQAGLNWKALGGKVSGSVNTAFANSRSREQSNQQAVSEAKEITERALERIVEKKRTERTIKLTESFLEKNLRIVDNRKGASHISAIYRFVDKIMKNEIHNYGKRVMLEFMIPEPAKLHKNAMLTLAQSQEGSTKVLVEPRDPRKHGLNTYENISRGSANVWASEFGASIDPEPEAYKWAGKAFSKSQTQDNVDHNTNKAITDSIDVPSGYTLNLAKVSAFFYRGFHRNHLNCAVGGQRKFFYAPHGDRPHGEDVHFTYHDFYERSVPVSVQFEHVWIGDVNIALKFKRTEQTYRDWQIKTFNAIIAAYEAKQELYEQKLASAEASEDALEREKAELQATNPLFYREIEQTTLKTNCMQYLLEKERLGLNFIAEGGTLKTHQVIRNEGLETYASTVKFMEQAFEWDIMSYQFYPFYWGSKERWQDLYTTEEGDKLFTKFLQSGMARVILTVRPGFEDAVNWFMATGQVWQGGNAPVIGDDLYLSIVDELREPEYTIGDTWESRVPTTLTVIQKSSIGLDAEGLPCDPDCAEEHGGAFIQDETTLANLEVPISTENSSNNTTT